MLKNNNQAVIRKMAVRSIRSNRKKNSLYLVAIVLAVLMLFTVMQTGASYMHMQYVSWLHSFCFFFTTDPAEAGGGGGIGRGLRPSNKKRRRTHG